MCILQRLLQCAEEETRFSEHQLKEQTTTRAQLLKDVENLQCWFNKPKQEYDQRNMVGGKLTQENQQKRVNQGLWRH